MKKYLAVILALVLSVTCFAACSKEQIQEEETKISEEESVISSEVNTEIEKFDGKIEILWDDIKEEYEKLETEAETEVENVAEVTKEDAQKLVTTIENDYDVIKDGISNDEKEVAKEFYKAAHKLDVIADKAEGDVKEEIEKLAETSKELVKHLHGEAERDYNVVKQEFETALQKVKTFGEDEWTSFVDKFNKNK